MSGIGIALAGARNRPTSTPDPDDGPLTLTFRWNGAVPLNVSSVSGETGYPNYFYALREGGVQPTTGGPTITYNPSGKFSLFPFGSQIGVAWNGMAINETQMLTVRYDVTDAAGTTRSISDSTVIKRIA
ncbi:hypothetical protein [Sphingomonas sp.]|uniref:hypothetical protein n=1 Tax=Sphingomonas sp. TaxID=28214 RepID=UPI003B3B4B39